MRQHCLSRLKASVIKSCALFQFILPLRRWQELDDFSPSHHMWLQTPECVWKTRTAATTQSSHRGINFNLLPSGLELPPYQPGQNDPLAPKTHGKQCRHLPRLKRLSVFIDQTQAASSLATFQKLPMPIPQNHSVAWHAIMQPAVKYTSSFTTPQTSRGPKGVECWYPVLIGNGKMHFLLPRKAVRGTTLLSHCRHTTLENDINWSHKVKYVMLNTSDSLG